MTQAASAQEQIVSVNQYPEGLLAVDTGFHRPRMACAWILESEGELAIVETGTNSTTPRILKVLAMRGLDVASVRFVIVTHVHLDHAGGAGSLMRTLPNAELVVHPHGARHMIHPDRLEASVRQVYGDETYDANYGKLIPVPEHRVRIVDDQDRLYVGQRTLVFRDTPGHARHHFCIWEEHSRGWFSGDVFGLVYPELVTDKGPFVFPTTTPIQFDPDALHQSLKLLMSSDPEWIYLTHYGRVGKPGPLAEKLHQDIDHLVSLAHSAAGKENAQALLEGMIEDWLMESLRQHGCTLEEPQLNDILQTDIRLNAQGLLFWSSRQNQ